MALGDIINQQEADFKQSAAGGQQTAAATTTEPATTTTTEPAATTTQAAATTTAEPATTTTTAFDEAKYLTDNFGGGSLNDIKARWGTLPTLEQEKNTLSEQLNKYKPDIEALEKGGEVARLFVTSIAKGVKPEVLAQIYNVKEDQLNDEQAWKMDAKLNKPYLSDEEVNALFNHKFFTDETELDPNVKLLKSAALKSEAQTARSGLKDYIGKTLNPTPAVNPAVEEAAAKARIAELQTTWQPSLPTLLNGLKTVSEQLPIQTFGAKAGEVTNVEVKYNVPETDQKAIMEQAYQTAIANGVKPDEQGLKSVQEYAEKLMWATHGRKIVKGYVDDVISHMTGAFEKIMNNPELARSIHNNTGDPGKWNAHEQSILGGMQKQGR